MEKEEAKERARFVSSAMLQLWRAECRRCIGSGVGVQVHVGRADDLLIINRAHVPGSVSLPASSLHNASTNGHSNGSSSSGSSSGSSSTKYPSPRGGYEVLGRTLAEWEAFVLEGSETQKR